ncbi:MAG TPA: hypothetical protein VN365_08190 [Candidatus Thermoplasmatota archaeon]|nr:hypothetical protein [Candidatus Thermoplasmatota archaeon]
MLIRKKWVDIEGKPKYRKYYLSRKYWTDLEKRRISAVLHKWDDNMVITSESLYRFYLDNPDGFNPLKRGDRSCPLEENNTFFLCGVPLDVIKNLSAEEKKNLNDWLIKVETYLWKIMELKYSKAKISVKEYIKKERQGKITTDDLIQSNTMGFYYSAYKSIIEE